MRFALPSALAALTLALITGAPAQAADGPAAAAAPVMAAGLALDGEVGVYIGTDGAAVSFVSQPGRLGYRGRHGYRDRYGYRGRHGYRGRAYGYPGGYRRPAYHRHYTPAWRAPCWTEQRYSHFRGRPAYVSVRICRDRYGRAYVQRGSERLLYYVHSRHRGHHYGRRW